MSTNQPISPRPVSWPHRIDPPQRYWSNYELYQKRGGLVRVEEDVQGFTAGGAGVSDMARFFFFCLAFDQLMKEGVRGDLAELGVYRGNTAVMLATMARRMGTTAWLLDTFEGFDSRDIKGVDGTRRLEFEDTSLEAVRALVGEDSVQYIKGYFPASAAQMPDELSFSLVHIDCDLYEPICSALDYFYHRLVPGGYLIIHDYASMGWDGAERAVDEFFADKPESIVPLPDSAGSVAIRKARTGPSSGNWLLQRRMALFSTEWVTAGRATLKEIMMSGWSGPEEWGVWGVGPSHVLSLHMEEMPSADVQVDCDVSAALVGARQTLEIDILVNGELLDTWNFTPDHNRGERRVRIPPSAIALDTWGNPFISLDFRPRSVMRANELDPSHKDERALGMALFKLKRA